MNMARMKWRNHVNNSRKKDVLPLDLETYLLKIEEAGIAPAQIGNAMDEYQLARYTDSGDYTKSSCRFVTTAVNLAEQRINGGTMRMAQKKLGRTKHNDASVAQQAMKMTGRRKETHPGIAIAALKRSAKLLGRTKANDAGRAAAALKNSRPYAFIAPDGNAHSGTNLNEFCQQMGLLGNAMNKVKTGRLKSYKGWTAVQHATMEAA